MTSKPSLNELFKTKYGKSSDKWDLYLEVYDRLFQKYHESRVDILEIGIQNGGSLEIWGEYFPNACSITGCDINPDCSYLEYSDKRISVVIGDATEDKTYKNVLLKSPSFDIIIEDGSHSSRDIVRSFCAYFATLSAGGIYIAEDLHCCYWHEFGGGLGYPYSGMEFFKALIDTVNANHWKRNEPTPASYVNEICSAYDTSVDAKIIESIDSIEFIDSICIIKKCKNGSSGRIQRRIIRGDAEEVAIVRNIYDQPASAIAHQQDSYEWHSLTKLVTVAESKAAIIEAMRRKLISLEAQVKMQDLIIDEQALAITTLYKSTSWRVSVSICLIGNLIKKLKAYCAYLTRAGLTTVKEFSLSKVEPQTSPSRSHYVLSGASTTSFNDQKRYDDSTIIAFYLPQYHRISENDLWWGPGFTEWTNVVKAQKNFDSHYQPHLPRELGFYDLSNIEVMREQARIAGLYGIKVFCFHYYWFSGRRILEKPVDNFLASDIDFQYCLCWANENWTRTWDGNANSILLEQQYKDNDPQQFIESLLPYFKDPRYLKNTGKPVLVVYRAKQIPNARGVFDTWRRCVASEGYPGLHIIAVDFYDIHRPEEVGADALVEFPPHKYNGGQNIPDNMPTFANPNFSGSVVEYTKVVAQSANKLKPDFTLYRCLMPSWDNTARRQNTPLIVHGSSPELFSSWLAYIRAYNRIAFANKPDNYIFINAWNEWGEGCHLEPDQAWGLAYLEAVKQTQFYSEIDDSTNTARKRLIEKLCMLSINPSESTEGFERMMDIRRSELMGIRDAKKDNKYLVKVLKRVPFLYIAAKAAYLKMQGKA